LESIGGYIVEAVKDFLSQAIPKLGRPEFLGSGFQVAIAVGSGIMEERLAGGNMAIALLANALATGAVSITLILTFGSISGAHSNPGCSLAARFSIKNCFETARIATRNKLRQVHMYSNRLMKPKSMCSC
jgi:hypothetical protein